jgi:Membrane bound FAD containing D-sorbitol dehydrogenase
MTEISRRALLAGATATAATIAFGGVLAATAAGQIPVDPDATAKLQFSELSAALTGIDKNILLPNVDPFKFNDEVFERARKADSARLDMLLNKFQGSAGNPAKTPREIHEDPDEDTRFLVRSIILAWYLGAWYDPKVLKQHSYQKTVYYSARRYSRDVLIPHEVISPSAYTRSMVWRVAQAHPMGYSNLQFGYWADNPPDQLLFINALQAGPK